VIIKGAWLGRGTKNKHTHGATHMCSIPPPPMAYTKPPCSCDASFCWKPADHRLHWHNIWFVNNEYWRRPQVLQSQARWVL